MNFRFFGFLICLLLGLTLSSQNTVGVITYEPDNSYPGYNLFYSHNQSNVYLIDACGEIVHEWLDSEEYRPGNAVYLLGNGNLVKCKRHVSSVTNAPIWAGGGGETVEILSWDNELIASFSLNDSIYRLHHDVAPMPNGNILMIAWESFSEEEAKLKGRDTSLIDDGEIWALAILEWSPVLDSIVWEWHTWDHLIQDIDTSLANYGVISEHHEKININYARDGKADWLHTNAIDYNPLLDHIVVSVPHFDELWIIDHSTSILEAASSTGGNSGMGGDLIYRWGNPIAYNAGDSTLQTCYFQHDVQWVNPVASEDDEDFGKLILYNNRLPNFTSGIGIVLTPIENFKYSFGDAERYGPDNFEKLVVHPDSVSRAFSSGLSSAQLFGNGNILGFSGRWGFAYEITPDNEVSWEYVIPLKNGERVNQGDSLFISDNLTFRMTRYGLDYPAFEGRNLEPSRYLEFNPDETYCDRLVSTEDSFSGPKKEELIVFPNPVSNTFTLRVGPEYLNQEYYIYDLRGRMIRMGNIISEETQVDISSVKSGIFILKVGYNSYYKIIKS